MNKKIIVVLILLISISLVSYKIYDRHNLDINFTGFYNNKEISKTYTLISNEPDDYFALKNLFFNIDAIFLSESSLISTISFVQNQKYEFTYEIYNNKLQIISVYDNKNSTILCYANYQGDTRCEGIMPVREFMARGRVISELEKLY